MIQKRPSWIYLRNTVKHFFTDRTEEDDLKDSLFNFFFTHYRRSETGGHGMPYLHSELAALDISHSAFCVLSIVSALIITHARAQLRPHLSASPFTLILSPKNGKIPHSAFVVVDYIVYTLHTIVDAMCGCVCMHKGVCVSPAMLGAACEANSLHHNGSALALEGCITGFIIYIIWDKNCWMATVSTPPCGTHSYTQPTLQDQLMWTSRNMWGICIPGETSAGNESSTKQTP